MGGLGTGEGHLGGAGQAKIENGPIDLKFGMNKGQGM